MCERLGTRGPLVINIYICHATHLPSNIYTSIGVSLEASCYAIRSGVLEALLCGLGQRIAEETAPAGSTLHRVCLYAVLHCISPSVLREVRSYPCHSVRGALWLCTTPTLSLTHHPLGYGTLAGPMHSCSAAQKGRDACHRPNSSTPSSPATSRCCQQLCKSRSGCPRRVLLRLVLQQEHIGIRTSLLRCGVVV